MTDKPKPTIAECCANPDNLVRNESPNGNYVNKCMVCGRNHYGMKIQPGKMGVTFFSGSGKPS